MVERRGPESNENLARPRLGIRRVLVAQHLGPAVLPYANRLHAGTISHMQAGELALVGKELGLDVVGAAPAAPYETTERHIRETRGRGPFAGTRVSRGRA